MKKAAIFIDGGYLFKVLHNEFGWIKVDYRKLSNVLASNMTLLRTYFYNCLPYQDYSQTVGDSERYVKALRFHDSLRRLPNFEVRLGRLAKRIKDGTCYYEQKMIDTQLTTDLVSLSMKQAIQHAIIVTGDIDFVPAIEFAKNEGVRVHLIHGSTPNSDLVSVCDEHSQLDLDLLSHAQLQSGYSTSLFDIEPYPRYTRRTIA